MMTKLETIATLPGMLWLFALSHAIQVVRDANDEAGRLRMIGKGPVCRPKQSKWRDRNDVRSANVPCSMIKRNDWEHVLHSGDTAAAEFNSAVLTAALCGGTLADQLEMVEAYDPRAWSNGRTETAERPIVGWLVVESDRALCSHHVGPIAQSDVLNGRIKALYYGDADTDCEACSELTDAS